MLHTSIKDSTVKLNCSKKQSTKAAIYIYTQSTYEYKCIKIYILFYMSIKEITGCTITILVSSQNSLLMYKYYSKCRITQLGCFDYL